VSYLTKGNYICHNQKKKKMYTQTTSCRGCEQAIEHDSNFCAYCGEPSGISPAVGISGRIDSLRNNGLFVAGLVYALSSLVMMVYFRLIADFSPTYSVKHALMGMLDISVYFVFAYYSKGRIRTFFIIAGFVFLFSGFYFRFIAI
jgi:hypothetical protein